MLGISNFGHCELFDIRMMARSLAWAEDNIQVNAILPGWINAELGIFFIGNIIPEGDKEGSQCRK